MSRDITMKEQVFASGALTEIPIPPIAGTPYRKPLASDGEIKPGWKYRDVVDSAAFNEVMYRTTSLVNQLEKDGVLIWSNKTNYPEKGIAKGPTDGKLYQAVQASGPGTPAGFKNCEVADGDYWSRYNDIEEHNQDPAAHGAEPPCYLIDGQYAQLPEITAALHNKIIKIIYKTKYANDAYINPYGTQKIMDHQGPLQASDNSEDYRSLILIANFSDLNWILIGGVNTWDEVSSVPINKTAITI